MSEDLDTPAPPMPVVRPGMLTCPVCSQTKEPAARVGTLAICGACGASLNVAADGLIRRANGQDTEVLSGSELALLTKARAAIARSDRRQR